jgi:hypothetical protein
MDHVTKSELLTPSVSRWADGLAIGLIAQTLSARHHVANLTKQRREALRRSFADLFADLRLDKEGYLRALPLSSLRALTNDDLSRQLEGGLELVARAKEAINAVVTSPKDSTPAVTAAARLVAHLCLEGTCSAAFIARCAKAVLSINWKWLLREEGWKGQADNYLTRLRALSTIETVDTMSRTQELQAFTMALPAKRPNWPFVENAIFHQLFAWPLLIHDSPEPLYDCFSLPVAVDVVFDKKSKVYIHAKKLGAAPQLQIRWEKELQEALTAAKYLWRSKHGGLSTHFRDLAMSASVSFNFSVGEYLISRTPFEPELVDSSMVPYMAQVILHRLLGRSVGFSCAVIGELGERRIGRDKKPSHDYVIKSAGHAGRKLAYVFQSEDFSSAVLPFGAPETVHAQARIATLGDKTFTEVNVCPFLSNTADAVQPKGWRQYDYKRCPDILRLMHLSSDELLPPDNPEVIDIGKILSRNEESILRFSERTGVLALASYLHHVNGVAREALTPFTPPSLSWTFIRAAEQENDRKLWHTIWDTMGARADEFMRLRQAANAADVAQHLANALNTFSPTETCLSHRAPDLLIVTNAEALVPSEWKEDAADYRSHLFDSVVDALEKCVLLPTPIEQMRQFIGRTRVIVMRAGGAEVVGQRVNPSVLLDGVQTAALDRLSTFRFGFTQQMAKIFLGELGHKGTAVREVLETLVDAGRLNYAAGKYWVAGGIGKSEPRSWTPVVRAQRHWAAAKAFAPYMAVTERALQVDLNSAFEPAAIHEALFHADTARRAETIRVNNYPAGHPERKLLHSISVFKGRMLRFVELASPGTINDLTKDHSGLSSVAAWELAQEHLDEKALLGIAPSPQECAIYARAGGAWLEDVQDDPNVDKERKADVLRNVMNLYDLALDVTEGAPEFKSRRLSILTHYGQFLHQFGDRDASNRNHLSSVREEIENLAGTGVRSSAVQAKFFEIEGDRCEEPNKARNFYRYMTVMAPKYRPGWVKLAGTDLKPESLIEIESTLKRAELFDETVAWAAKQVRFPIKSGLDTPVVRQRWIAGVSALTARASGSPGGPRRS